MILGSSPFGYIALAGEDALVANATIAIQGQSYTARITAISVNFVIAAAPSPYVLRCTNLYSRAGIAIAPSMVSIIDNPVIGILPAQIAIQGQQEVLRVSSLYAASAIALDSSKQVYDLRVGGGPGGGAEGKKKRAQKKKRRVVEIHAPPVPPKTAPPKVNPIPDWMEPIDQTPVRPAPPPQIDFLPALMKQVAEAEGLRDEQDMRDGIEAILRLQESLAADEQDAQDIINVLLEMGPLLGLPDNDRSSDPRPR